MPGPAANPNALRRNARPNGGVVTLPAAGRSGPPPEWPLLEQTAAECEAWETLWASPQATQWEALGYTRSVARYARMLVDAEEPGAPAALLAEVRQMEDRLGLSPMSMRRLMWQIDKRTAPEGNAASVANLDDYRDL